MQLAKKYEPIPVYDELKKAFDHNFSYFNKDLTEFVAFTSGVVYSYCVDTIEVIGYKIKNWEGGNGLLGYIKLYK